MARTVLSRRSFVTLAGAGTAAAFGIPAYLPRIGEAADTIKIGLLEPYTGVYAGPGENETNGFQMAVDAWNKRGGAMGRKVELVKEDEQNDPGVAAQKARKLVNQDKVVALVGTVSSAVSLSVAGVSNSLNTLFIDSGGHTDDVTGKSCHWNVFRTCHSTWMETHATGYSLQKRFGKKWFFITPDYAYGHALESGFKDVLAHIGGTVVGNELTPLGTTDFSSYLTKIDAAKPDLVLVFVQGDDYTNCLKQMNQFGLLKKYPVGGPQVELEPLYGLPPEARGGYWGVEWYYKSEKTLGKNNKLAHAFVADYMKRFNKPPTARSCFGYVTADRLINAMAETKSTESVKIAHALENTRFTSIFNGSAYYRKEDHQLMWPMWVAKIRPNGTPGDKDDLFDVVDINAPEAIEQTVAQKEAVCKLGYP
ncbi:ABC transporter substrate-binding protein [Vulcanimicrobium alpinum]|uniref:ABC transporter substrate-binding protein n=1 Tax=Vulcanimicrobium alpinum TaxID=3016050 RepID=A0AAN2CB09_UNVUL|nr:ABC transporter substrate-binding protein [Vulcanimicrobium alpinum]BDE07919.1 ABC transporter substrate-binding protein [Vulcanimicrobium alpinum]